MKDGTASRTARGVAAHRLEFDRVAAGHGDPAADEALSRDVADGLTPRRDRMHERLRARTAFFDFRADPVAAPLRAAGLARRALSLFEGVAVYLDRPVIERVLAEFREVTTAGGLLAISVSSGTATAAARARFQERVAGIGEPARSMLTPGEAAELLAAVGWELAEAGGRPRSAGLLLARATASPSG